MERGQGQEQSKEKFTMAAAFGSSFNVENPDTKTVIDVLKNKGVNIKEGVNSEARKDMLRFLRQSKIYSDEEMALNSKLPDLELIDRYNQIKELVEAGGGLPTEVEQPGEISINKEKNKVAKKTRRERQSENRQLGKTPEALIADPPPQAIQAEAPAQAPIEQPDAQQTTIGEPEEKSAVAEESTKELPIDTAAEVVPAETAKDIEPIAPTLVNRPKLTYEGVEDLAPKILQIDKTEAQGWEEVGALEQQLSDKYGIKFTRVLNSPEGSLQALHKLDNVLGNFPTDSIRGKAFSPAPAHGTRDNRLLIDPDMSEPELYEFLKNEFRVTPIEAKSTVPAKIIEEEDIVDQKFEPSSGNVLDVEPISQNNIETRSIIDEQVHAETDEKLAKARLSYVKAKKSLDKFNAFRYLKAKLPKESKTDTEIRIRLALMDAQQEYEKARSEYIGAKAEHYIAEKRALEEAHLNEYGKLDKGLGKNMRKLWTKAGEWSVHKLISKATGWEIKNWAGARVTKAFNVKTAVYAGLVYSGANFAAMGLRTASIFYGSSGLAEQVRQARKLKPLDVEKIKAMDSLEEVEQRLERIRSLAYFDGYEIEELSKRPDVQALLSREQELINALPDNERAELLKERFKIVEDYRDKALKQEKSGRRKTKTIGLAAALLVDLSHFYPSGTSEVETTTKTTNPVQRPWQPVTPETPKIITQDPAISYPKQTLTIEADSAPALEIPEPSVPETSPVLESRDISGIVDAPSAEVDPLPSVSLVDSAPPSEDNLGVELVDEPQDSETTPLESKTIYPEFAELQNTAEPQGSGAGKILEIKGLGDRLESPEPVVPDAQKIADAIMESRPTPDAAIGPEHIENETLDFKDLNPYAETKDTVDVSINASKEVELEKILNETKYKKTSDMLKSVLKNDYKPFMEKKLHLTSRDLIKIQYMDVDEFMKFYAHEEIPPVQHQKFSGVARSLVELIDQSPEMARKVKSESMRKFLLRLAYERLSK
jgi:hypothetical protein